MLRAVRLFVICLLVAAVPLKGIAGLSMIGCGPGHHATKMETRHAEQASVAAFNPSGHELHVAHGAGAPVSATPAGSAATPGNGVAFAANGTDGTSAPDLPGQAGDAKAAKAAKCSSCAPCCAAAAPGGEPPRMAEPAPADSRPFARVSDVPSGAAEAPLRPPRLSLA